MDVRGTVGLDIRGAVGLDIKGTIGSDARGTVELDAGGTVELDVRGRDRGGTCSFGVGPLVSTAEILNPFREKTGERVKGKGGGGGYSFVVFRGQVTLDPTHHFRDAPGRVHPGG